MGETVITTKFSSDSYVVKKEWTQIKNRNLSFEYPNKFIELNLGEEPENIDKMAYFSDKKEDRFAMNLIFDFKEEPPAATLFKIYFTQLIVLQRNTERHIRFPARYEGCALRRIPDNRKLHESFLF